MAKLIADIGATNARFAIVEGGKLDRIEVLPCEAYPGLAEAARHYLDIIGAAPRTGIFAVAAPLDGTDRVEMMNHSWAFSIRETATALNLTSLRVVNDFTALAHAVPYLAPEDYYQVGAGSVQKGAPIAIIGPGTGLGVAGIVFDKDGKPVPVTTEGGHVTMPAGNLREFQLFEWLKKTKYSHVSAERILSGKGLVNLYQAINGLDSRGLPERTAAEITDAALARSCDACAETLALFCRLLGVIAGNLALSYGSFGGVYIAGGIVPRLGDYFPTSHFREAFLDKGRYRGYMDRISTFVITHPYPGMEGLKYAD